jgi:hypothetical protein
MGHGGMQQVSAKRTPSIFYNSFVLWNSQHKQVVVTVLI